MGSGSWSSATYSATTARKVATGTSFGYSTTAHSTGVYEAHEDLDPKKVNGPDSPLAGQNIRESRDSDEHPTSVPVAVFFDETGSMGNTPRVLQKKLAELFGVILRKGYLEHPQIMIGGYGDGVVDYAPLQVSQFESDNRIDDALDNLFLEGNGGGNFGESQWLAWYYTATHTATDAWEKREKKGYAFFIGDEKSLPPAADQVKKWVGDGEPLVSPLTDEAIVKELLSKWEAYVFVIDNHSAKSQKSVEYYSNLFGPERVLVVQDETAIAETIALTIGMTEGVIDLDDGVDDLKDAGASDAAIAQATQALALYKNKTNIVVAEDAPADLDTVDDDTVTRL
jgi:hypothetical protein